jgi:ribose 5-phosphate isomerase B
MKVLMIAADHGGWELKEKIKQQFPHIAWVDFGPTNSEESVDYPDFADLVCNKIKPEGNNPQGILVCGSGQGMAIRANKFPAVRAALVWSEESSRLAREHNNANVLCLGGRLLSTETAMACVKAFIETPFAGGRHSLRLEKLHKPTSNSNCQ